MIELLALLGIGLVVAVVSGSDGGDDDDASELGEFTDGDDSIVDEGFRVLFEANAVDLVSSGEVTQAEADAALDELNFTTGAINVSTGAGADNVAAGDGDDSIDTGRGQDVVFGGEGDDFVDLGSGADVYGQDQRVIDTEDDFLSFPEVGLFGDVGDQMLEGGNDVVLGGPGNDAISDSFGSNNINGQQGADFIVTVDDDTGDVTADTVNGGFGNDTLVVDQGDTVTTSRGADLVTVDVFGGVDDGYTEVTITDFNRDLDRIELEGGTDLLFPAEPSGPDDVVTNPITVADLDDGSGAVISVNGIPVVRVIGGAGLTAQDVLLSI